jgi:hypothetical protein
MLSNGVLVSLLSTRQSSIVKRGAWMAGGLRWLTSDHKTNTRLLESVILNQSTFAYNRSIDHGQYYIIQFTFIFI